ncbi:tail fiber protein [Enterobacter phage vB_EclS_AS5]
MVHQSGVWGCYNEKDFQYVALKIDQGGTGAKDAAGARENIGLGVSSTPEFRSLELGKSNKDSAAYVDFHYGAKYDYDARIVCDGYNSDQVGGGNLRFYAGYINMDTKGSYSFTGGRINIETTDFNIRCPAITYGEFKLAGGSIQVPASADATAPIGAGLRGIHAGTDTNNFDNASNINLYSWYGVAFCTAYTSPTNGIKQGKPAVLINTRDGNINTLGLVISKGVTLTCDFDKKADVTELDGEFVSDLLDKVGTYSYRYKDGSRYTAGVIAQELQNWMPQLVSSNDADGSLQVDYMGLLGYMHAAFKDEKAKRKSLEDRVKKLEAYLAFKFPEDFE